MARESNTRERGQDAKGSSQPAAHQLNGIYASMVSQSLVRWRDTAAVRYLMRAVRSMSRYGCYASVNWDIVPRYVFALGGTMNDDIATLIANRMANVETALNTIATTLQEMAAQQRMQMGPVQQVQARPTIRQPL